MLHYSLIGFVLASCLTLLACWIVYRLLFENVASPDVNRRVLLSVYALSIAVPLSVMFFPVSSVGTPQIDVGDIFLIKGNGTTNVSEFEPGISFNRLATLLYLVGAAVLAVITIVSFFRLVALRKTAEKAEILGRRVYIHDMGMLSSFTFGKSIFMSRTQTIRPDDLEVILCHEEAHARQNHWADLLLAQLFIIFQWFNPAAWLIRKELQNVHEYLADKEVLGSDVDPVGYQMLLIRNLSGNRFSGLTDGLNNCSLKNRLIMMQKKQFAARTFLRAGGIAAMALLAGLIIHIPAVASRLGSVVPVSSPAAHKSMGVEPAVKVENLRDPEKIEEMKASYVEPVEQAQETKESKGDVKEKEPQITLTVQTVENTEDSKTVWIVDGKRMSAEEVKLISPDVIESMTVDKSSEPPLIILTTKSPEKSNPETATKAALKVVSATTAVRGNSEIYEGGMDRLLFDLTQTVKFPEEMKNLTEPKQVVMEIVISPSGNLENINIVRSQGEIFDNAAIAGVKALPGKWIPAEENGKSVVTSFYLPVTFRAK